MTTAAVGPPTLDDALGEALRLIDLADERGLLVRLMGGLAFHAAAPGWRAEVDRPGRDIDLATRAVDRKGLAELLEQAGYTPHRRSNAVHAHKQMYFFDAVRGRPVDVLIERFEMCHAFEFRDRLSASRPTLPYADLLLSKLQIVKINRKDVLDSLVLLAEHPLSQDDAGINVGRITGITSTDWGWWRTTTSSLRHLISFAADELTSDDLDVGRPHAFDPAGQAQQLLGAIESAPKSTSWKLRSRVGDRVRWYEDPEELTR